MKPKSHIFVWLIIMFVAILAVPAMFKPNDIRQHIHHELVELKDVFGAKRSHAIMRTANETYKEAFQETGFLAWIESWSTDKSRTTGIGSVDQTFGTLGDYVNDYLLSLAAMFYIAVVRALTWFTWMIYLGGFMVACIVDGIAVRRIKHSGFGFFNPTVFGLSMHTVILCLFFPLVYLLMPLPLPHWFTPIWALVLGLSMRNMIPHVTRLHG